MSPTQHDALEGQVAAVIGRLHALFDALPERVDAADAISEIDAIAHATGGELLFELPADHPQLGESQWAVLRYQHEDGERFVHLFFSPAGGRRWIGQESDAPAEFANFAHAWTDVLTRCIADLDSARASLRAAS